jgi:hypothetical protein
MYQSRFHQFIFFSVITSAALFLQSCASATAGLAVSNVPLENKQYEILGPAESSRSWITFDMGIIGFPLTSPPIDEAIQDLLTQKGGDALINLRYYTERWVFLGVNYNRFFIKADVVRINAPPSTPGKKK